MAPKAKRGAAARKQAPKRSPTRMECVLAETTPPRVSSRPGFGNQDLHPDALHAVISALAWSVGIDEFNELIDSQPSWKRAAAAVGKIYLTPSNPQKPRQPTAEYVSDVRIFSETLANESLSSVKPQPCPYNVRRLQVDPPQPSLARVASQIEGPDISDYPALSEYVLNSAVLSQPFPHMPSLTSLSLTDVTWACEGDILTTLGRCCPNLRSLTLKNVHAEGQEFLPPPALPRLGQDIRARSFAVFPHLETFDWSDYGHPVYQAEFGVFVAVPVRRPVQLLRWLRAHAPCLAHLKSVSFSLADAAELEDALLSNDLPRLSSLEAVVASDSSVPALLAAFPALDSLTLTVAPCAAEISSYGIFSNTIKNELSEISDKLPVSSLCIRGQPSPQLIVALISATEPSLRVLDIDISSAHYELGKISAAQFFPSFDFEGIDPTEGAFEEYTDEMGVQCLGTAGDNDTSYAGLTEVWAFPELISLRLVSNCPSQYGSGMPNWLRTSVNGVSAFRKLRYLVVSTMDERIELQQLPALNVLKLGGNIKQVLVLEALTGRTQTLGANSKLLPCLRTVVMDKLPETNQRELLMGLTGRRIALAGDLAN